MTKKSKWLLHYAKEMRQHMTDAEMRLWWYLQYGKKVYGKFRRQQPMQNYILDFVSFEHRIIIEVDGSQHTSEKDAARDAFLTAEGFRVLRFTNFQVLHEINSVMAVIQKRA